VFLGNGTAYTPVTTTTTSAGASATTAGGSGGSSASASGKSEASVVGVGSWVLLAAVVPAGLMAML
jgi:hypothetical protein